MTELMRAVTSRKYGGPEVMRCEQIERPVPKEDQVLIKVAASSVNPYDWHLLRGKPWLLRAAEKSFWKPKHQVLGADIARTVAAVGAKVTKFNPGDDVFGDIGTGAFAQYACATPDLLTLKPNHVSFADAGVVGIAGLTALQALRDWAGVKPGDKVLVNGASGGVGAYAVQIAKILGAEVTAVCSTANVELVRGLGADHVIDYKRDDFTTADARYEVVLDLAANRSIGDIKHVMAPKSTWLHVGYNLGTMLKIGVFGRLLFSKSGKSAVIKIAEVRADDLVTLGKMLASGQIRSVIDRTYPLNDTPKAIEYIETMRAKGKVAIAID